MGGLQRPEASQHYLMTGEHDKRLEAPRGPRGAPDSPATRFCSALRGAQSPHSERSPCVPARTLSGSGFSCELHGPETGDITALVFRGWLLNFSPFASGSRAKLGFATPGAALRKTSAGVFVRPFLSGRFCREPHSSRKGHPAHFHGANENTANSLGNRVRHASRAAGFIRGHAVKTPKMFPKKNAHKNISENIPGGRKRSLR